MPGTSLDIAFWDYDRTRALKGGRVAIDGVEARYHTARIVPEISADAPTTCPNSG